MKFEDFFTIFDKMGKAKKLKISKAPRNTPLEENITKVRAVYGRILVKSSEIYTSICNFSKLEKLKYIHALYVL